MTIRVIFRSLFLLSILASCNLINKKQEGRDSENTSVIARVHDSFLYVNQLPGIFSEYSRKDSAVAVQQYRDEWIRAQLLAETAAELVQEDEPDIQEKVKEYTKQLQIAEYKRRYVQRHLDTTITAAQIKDFYSKDSLSFLLKEDLIKGYFIKVPSNVPQLNSVKDIIGKKGSDKDLFSFCVRYAKGYKLNQWFPYGEIYSDSPLRFEESDRNIGIGSIVEKSDAEFSYLVYVKDKRKAGQIAPMEYVEESIRNLIINERKFRLIENLEEEIYNEGKKSGKFEIY